MPEKDIQKILGKHDEQIKALGKHAEKTNSEMGEMNKLVSEVKTDIKWITEGLKKTDTKMWGIIILLLGVLIKVLLL